MRPTSDISKKFLIPAPSAPRTHLLRNCRVYDTDPLRPLLLFLQDPCASDPCKANQTCEPNVGPKGYKCACSKGYAGDACNQGDHAAYNHTAKRTHRIIPRCVCKHWLGHLCSRYRRMQKEEALSPQRQLHQYSRLLQV